MFTRYADPGKLKAYVAAGLPIILTVPPNAHELATRSGSGDHRARPALAREIARALGSAAHWQKQRKAALAYCAAVRLVTPLSDLLQKLCLEPH